MKPTAIACRSNTGFAERNTKLLGELFMLQGCDFTREEELKTWYYGGKAPC